MKINIIIIGLFLVSILVLSGCVQQQTKYVCSDGTIVSDASLCPKQESTVECTNNQRCVDLHGSGYVCDLTTIGFGRCVKSQTP
jgi:hypothetical protein